MTTPAGEWRKSSYSGTNGDCVEFHRAGDAIRDSKNHQVLPLTRSAVVALVRVVKQEL